MLNYTDKEFIEAWSRLKSTSKVAKHLNMPIRSVQKRRRSLESKHGIELNVSPDKPYVEKHAARVNVEIENGCAIVFSDAHFWDTNPTTAYRALLKFIKELKPQLIVCNGDAFDGATISRHPKIGFMETKPTVIQELNACQEMLGGIEKVAKGCTLTWPLGNHDSRFEAYVAAQAPQYEFVHGFHLKDHFPRWQPCWTTWINGHTCIKHRWKGGIHATHNNTVGSGVSIVTGHLHSLKVTPYTDYNGTRYGVDTGTLADVDDQQFLHYTEDNPKNWRSGFAVLSFHNGHLLPPELVQVLEDGVVHFRGKVYTV